MRSSLAYDSSKDSAWFHDRSFQVHLKKLQEIRGRNLQPDSSTNAGIRASLSRLKALSFAEAERIETIKRENKILMKKLVAIAEAKADRPLGKSLEHRSLNFQLRKKEEDRIRLENEAFNKRLELKEGYLSKKKLDFSFNESERHRKRISKVNILKGKLQGHLPPLNESDSDSKLNVSAHTEMKAKAKVNRSTKGYSRTLDVSPLNGSLHLTDFTKSPGGVTLEQYLDSKGDIAVLADKKNVRKPTKAIQELPEEHGDMGSGRVNPHSKRSSVNPVASGSQPASTRNNKDSPRRDLGKTQKPRPTKVDPQSPKEDAPSASSEVLKSTDELDSLPPRFDSETGKMEVIQNEELGIQSIKKEIVEPTQELHIVEEEKQSLERLQQEESIPVKNSERAKEEKLFESSKVDATLELQIFEDSKDPSTNQEASPHRETSAKPELPAQKQSLPEGLEHEVQERAELVEDPEELSRKASQRVTQDTGLIAKSEQKTSGRAGDGDEFPMVNPEPKEGNMLLAQVVEAHEKEASAEVDENDGLMVKPKETSLVVTQDAELHVVKPEEALKETDREIYAEEAVVKLEPEPKEASAVIEDDGLIVKPRETSLEVSQDIELPAGKPEQAFKETDREIDEEVPDVKPALIETSVRVDQISDLLVKPEPEFTVSSSEAVIKPEPEPKEASAVVDDGAELSMLKPEQEPREENVGTLESHKEAFQGAEPKSPTANIKEIKPEFANLEHRPSALLEATVDAMKEETTEKHPEEVFNPLNEPATQEIDPKSTGTVQHEEILASKEEFKAAADVELPQDRS